jgi:hypothetical protein
MQSFLTVLVNPVEGREAEFNDWYTNVHIRDVMRFAGSIRVQQFIASETQVQPTSHKYFTLYDTFDPALLTLEHQRAAGSRRMVVGTAHDKPGIINGYYYPIAARTNEPTTLTPDHQPLILEQINVPEVDRDAFEDWYASVRLPELLRCPSHVSGVIMRFDPAGQMAKFEPIYSHVALWRVADVAAALPTWKDADVPAQLGLLKRRISIFEVMKPYLTRDDVINAPPEELEIEESARRRTEQSNAAARLAAESRR